MPAENALAFLRSIDGSKPPPNPVLIAGPQAFLREYVLDAVARRLMRDGLKYRAFQIANAADSTSVMEELRASDLFALQLRSAASVVTVGTTTHGNLSGVALYGVLPCVLVVRISNGYITDAKTRPV